MRLIDADALKARAIRCSTIRLGDAPVFFKAVGTKEIDKAPTVDAEPVRHGHWVKSKDGYHRCSVCESRGSAIKARYCHHCGAKMDGERKENT